MDEPELLFAAMTSEGDLWEYRSINVEDDAEFREETVCDRIKELGLTLVFEKTSDDDEMWGRKAIERLYRKVTR
jgi:hypothetical protein